ncbi:MAG TPA: electron transport complex subunit RsxC [Burkholderiales bacterium]|nr:electron transport complex subunit RsxC [Burkholderiales bacterium]
MSVLRRLLSRSWGVHPDDRKRPASEAPARAIAAPAVLHIPLAQHVGAAARPAVAVGQRVLKGQCIAAAHGAISAPVHASASGRVIAIGEVLAPHPSGLPVQAITIESDGEERWIEAELPADPLRLDPAEVAKRVAEAGVVGLGGATFPASVKLGLGLRARVRTLIINGSECEPYLSCDDRLMRERAAEVLRGVRLMLHATGAREALVGIEANKPEAVAAMRAAAQRVSDVRVCVVPPRYPMGSDRQLILELTGIEVPADSRAADTGVLVHNVGTAFAVHEAVALGRPLVSRYVTVNGEAVREPGNYIVPIGTLVDDLLAACGGLREAPARLLMGGPMMGLALPSGRAPVVKGTGGILALSAAEVGAREPGPCIRCGSCVRACPVGLLPLEMARHVQAGSLDGAVDLGLKDCIACGCCAWVCPSRIPLVQAFAHAKGELAERERARLRRDAARKLAQARAERIAREDKERAEAAARRKAERDAARAAQSNPEPA